MIDFGVVVMFFRRLVEKCKKNKTWRKYNQENFTMGEGYYSIENVTVGKYTYGMVDSLIFSDDLKLNIGSYCSIAPNVKFLVGTDHPISNISTYPFKVKVMGEKYEAISKGNVCVSDDVWIGENAIILSGINIGQGAVIAAGAVVTKDVPPYAVVGGVPATIIKYRFNQSVIDYMLTLDYSALDEELICNHIDELYTSIDNLDLDVIKDLLSWFPKK